MARTQPGLEVTALSEGSPDLTVQYVELNMLRIGAYQRSVERRFIERLARDWDDNLAGVLEVNVRASGEVYLIDGQARTAALLQRGHSVWRAIVHRGLDEQGEAHIYRQLQNKRRKLAVFDDWRASVSERDPETLGITRVLDRFGFTVSRSGSDPRSIAAIEPLRRIYRRGGSTLLVQVLSVCHYVWDDDRRGLDGRIIDGLGMFLSKHGADPSFRESNLHEQLGLRPASDVLRRAYDVRGEAMAKGGLGKEMTGAVYLALVAIYNGRRSRGRLQPKW